MNVKKALERGLLRKIVPDNVLVRKELEEAKSDLERAKKTFEEGPKWAIVQAYYSMFHSARALLFKVGYKEKGHMAILAVLEAEAAAGKLEQIYVDMFKAGMRAREDADYNSTYSTETAELIIESAEDFLKKIGGLV